MTAKITLYSEEELLKNIKKFAKEQKISISKLVNDFFETLLSVIIFYTNFEKNLIFNIVTKKKRV